LFGGELVDANGIHGDLDHGEPHANIRKNEELARREDYIPGRPVCESSGMDDDLIRARSEPGELKGPVV
jgi:hypothetical protein